jgi:hypothetical protein
MGDSEKVFRAGVERDNDLMYYIKGGDVWAVPRKRPDEPKGEARKVVSAGIEMDYAKYLYFLDGDGDIARKPRAVTDAPATPSPSGRPAGDVGIRLKRLADELTSLDEATTDDDDGAKARRSLRRLIKLADELADESELRFTLQRKRGDEPAAARAMSVLLDARSVASDARDQHDKLMQVWLAAQGAQR